MDTWYLVPIILLFSPVSCTAPTPGRADTADASAEAGLSGPCRDSATTLDVGAPVTCPPDAELVLDFSPVTGAPVVVCRCRRAEPGLCEEFLDWQETPSTPSPMAAGPH